MNPSITEHWNRIPPLFCVLIARRNGRALRLGQIAEAAGMSKQRAQWIYRQDSWDNVPVAEMDRFAAACGLTMQTFRRQLAYLKRTLQREYPLAHVETLPPAMLKRMTARVERALGGGQ